MHPTPVRRTIHRPIDYLGLGAAGGRAAPRASSSRSRSNSLVLLFVVLFVDGMTISFVHAYTLPGTDPAEPTPLALSYNGLGLCDSLACQESSSPGEGKFGAWLVMSGLHG
jgi:hypothetical protein